MIVGVLESRPSGETDFRIPPQEYRRAIYRCGACSVYLNAHAYDLDALYRGAYNRATYAGNLRVPYDRIMALPEGKSDNKPRVRRVHEFCRARGWEPAESPVLDVGSGLAVFAGELGKLGYPCYCLDPDPTSARHAVEFAGAVDAHAGTLEDYVPPCAPRLVTLNKVLEHVADPRRLLRRAASLIAKGGALYIELPDGEAALRAAPPPEREEFYIEHYTAFDPRSLAKLLDLCGLKNLETRRVFEPSGKYTIFAFAERSDPDLAQTRL